MVIGKTRSPLSASQDASPLVAAVENNEGNTRVETEGMEGVVSQRADNSFTVAYNDYVDTTKFPTQHVVHVANLFKEKLGSIKFGANREEESAGENHSGKIRKLKKAKVIGPRGIPKPPIFGSKAHGLGTSVGSKRKKSSKELSPAPQFVDESQGNSCLIFVDKVGVKDVFAENSGVHVSVDSVNGEDSEDQAKKARVFLDSLRSDEGSFDTIPEDDDVGAQAERGKFLSDVNHDLGLVGDSRRGQEENIWMRGIGMKGAKKSLNKPGQLKSGGPEDKFHVENELWTARNRAFHDRINPSWRGVLARVQRAAACLLSVWDSRPNSEAVQHVFEELYVGKTVLFVDAAFKDLRAAAGIVVSESEGRFSEAMTVTFEATQPLEAEAWAVFYAVKWCQSRGWRRVKIVSDCLLLVQGLRSRRAPDWRLTGVFWSLLEMLNELPEVEVVWLPRSQVLAAHLLAKWAFALNFSGFLSAEELVPLVTN
ncbi:hypothetical protein G4B88_003254 [Cannabis sativa]|uniref:RNase H type-1 domain-containing protein n=1 Tax=Cannabis sativa TaxID=3483 RepID=A0A7J6I477_CANSA|nr:hypothetical protein G4B88_003254 [Cannabis sativa]